MGDRQVEPPPVLPPVAKLRRLSQEWGPSQEVLSGRAPTSPPPLCLAGGPRAPAFLPGPPGHLSWQVSSWSLGSLLLAGPLPYVAGREAGGWMDEPLGTSSCLCLISSAVFLLCGFPSVSAELCLPPGLSQPFCPHLLPISQEFPKHSDLADSNILWFVTVA